MSPQEYLQSQKAKLLACYHIEKSVEVEKPIEVKDETPQVIDVELITDQERLSEIKEQTFVEKAFDIINKSLDVFEKGGEGSRGGKVIGHTKSGKPIYANFERTNNNPVATDYSKFTLEDHKDALKAHEDRSHNEKHKDLTDEEISGHMNEAQKIRKKIREYRDSNKSKD